MTQKGQILKSASAITLVTVISRICGYLRDQRVVLLLGTSSAADSFVLAFQIPNLIRRLVGEGTLSASFIPVFTQTLRHSPAAAWKLAQRTFWLLAVVLSVVAILGVIFSRPLIHLFTLFGGHSSSWDLAIFLNRIIFPYIFFIGLAALAMAVLNSFHVFALPASTSIYANLVIIAFSFAFLYKPILHWTPAAFRSPAVALACGVVLGGAVQLAVLIPPLLRRGMNFAPALSLADPGVRRVSRLLGPSFLGVSIYQVNFIVDKIFAASPRMPSGSITSLYIGERVMELVLGSYAIAMATALLPSMSHQAAAGHFAEMKRTFGFSLRIVSFITLPAAVGLMLFRRPIIQVLFQHGQFSPSSVLLTARALFWYSLGLPAFAAIKLITPMYSSTQDTMTPARIAACSLALNIALNTIFLLFFVRILSNGGPALASSLAAYFNFAVLVWVFRRRYGRLGAHGLIASHSKMIVSTAAMTAVCLAAIHFSPPAASAHFLMQVAWLVAMILVSAAVYFGIARLLRCQELSELFLLLRRSEEPGSAALRV
ncbi:MAG: murein biosynthesis integral membrane protein MurJ [Candidatus Acidiferrales bacterium]